MPFWALSTTYPSASRATATRRRRLRSSSTTSTVVMTHPRILGGRNALVAWAVRWRGSVVEWTCTAGPKDRQSASLPARQIVSQCITGGGQYAMGRGQRGWSGAGQAGG